MVEIKGWKMCRGPAWFYYGYGKKGFTLIDHVYRKIGTKGKNAEYCVFPYGLNAQDLYNFSIVADHE